MCSWMWKRANSWACYAARWCISSHPKCGTSLGPHLQQTYKIGHYIITVSLLHFSLTKELLVLVANMKINFTCNICLCNLSSSIHISSVISSQDVYHRYADDTLSILSFPQSDTMDVSCISVWMASYPTWRLSTYSWTAALNSGASQIPNLTSIL